MNLPTEVDSRAINDYLLCEAESLKTPSESLLQILPFTPRLPIGSKEWIDQRIELRQSSVAKSFQFVLSQEEVSRATEAPKTAQTTAFW